MASETLVEMQGEPVDMGDETIEVEKKCAIVDVTENNEGLNVKELVEDTKLDVNEGVKKEPTKTGIYKVTVYGLPRYYPIGEFKKIVKDDLGLALDSMKCAKRGIPWLQLTFSTEEEQAKAQKALHKYTYRRKKLTCNIVSNDTRKRKPEEGSKEDIDAKKAKLDMSIERVLMITLPYHNIPYDEQLKKKTGEFKAMIQRLENILLQQNPKLTAWAKQQKDNHDGLICKLEEIRSSPVIDAYRNKCKFRIGLNPDTQERTVGCRLENIKDGTVGVGPADSLKHLPDQMKEAVKLFQDFVRQSDREPFSVETREGYWRYLIVRVSCNGDIMLVVLAHPQSLSEEELTKVKDDLRDYFANKEGKTGNVTSLYFQKFAEKAIGVPLLHGKEMEHLYGKTHLEETMLSVTFYLTPTSYFQVNTKGAEVLYSSIIELVEPTEETTVLDLCCGTGGIGLCIAKKCGQVFGIEDLAQNIKDAQYNAEQNNITNCEFIAGRVEDVLPTLKDKITGKTVVPILDPSRTGLNKEIISQLRKFDNIQKLIYICSNHKNTTRMTPMRNFLDLCCYSGIHTMTGNPFLPVKAIPVDVVPHTLHAQIVILLERVDPTTLPKTAHPPTIRVNQHKTARGRGRGTKNINSRVSRVLNRGIGRDFTHGINQGFSRNINRDVTYNFSHGYGIRNSDINDPVMNMQVNMRERDMSRGSSTSGMRIPASMQPYQAVGRELLMPPLHEGHSLLHGIRDNRSAHLVSREIPPLIPSYGASRRHQMDFSSDERTLSRYSDFRRDVEDAIDSSLGSLTMRYQRDGGNFSTLGENFSTLSSIIEREEIAYRAGFSRGLDTAPLLQPPNIYSQYGQRAVGRFKESVGTNISGGKRGGVSHRQGNYRGRGGYR